jgi:dTDP-4-amino-4,6-dideoxygalactose transaminase
MRFGGALRPVGEPVPIFPQRARSLAWPEGYRVLWMDSGTSALAVAARYLVEKSGKPTPAIVLPAYTCPDVVSAVVWAGARPVLVDTLPGLPWLDEAQLDVHRDESWIGVVAPHFLGLAAPLASLRNWCESEGMGLIEDSAQLSPRSPAFQPTADLVVLSFGRGKPIPAGGGALLVRQAHEARVLEIVGQLPEATGSPASWRLRAAIQDFAITRPGYRLVKSLPGLHVGETRFKPLATPRRLSSGPARLAADVIAGWRHDSHGIASDLAGIVAEAGWTSLPARCGWEAEPLLRFPVLLEDAAACRRAFTRLEPLGLGVTRMYEDILPRIDGMPSMEVCGTLPNARSFAASLLTLPVHSGVTPKDLALLKRELGPRSQR